MANLVKKVRTSSGDLQIDYNALANKPTVATLGAVSKSGDTMTGNLVISNDSTSPALGLQASDNANGEQAYSRIYKNANATADYGLQFRDYAHGGNETGDSTMLVLCSKNEELKDKIKLVNEDSGTSTGYRLYGEHNKPDINALPGTLSIENGGTGATTVDGMRANLGNLGKVYRSNPVDFSVANNTTVTLASLTLPAGTYVVTGNHVWDAYTAGSIYNDCIRGSNDKIYCFCRNLMDNGGGAACCAIIELTAETTITYETRHFHTSASKVVDVHFYAIKIK